MGLLLLPLNVIFFLIDKRSRGYLLDVTDYAKSLEEKYEFGGKGLTSFIREKIGGRESSTRIAFYGVYGLFAVIGLIAAVLKYG